MFENKLTPLRKYLPYVLALANFLLIGWISIQVINHPRVGASWSFVTGKVQRVDKGGPADQKLQVGDVIKDIDGVPQSLVRLMPGRKPGEIVHFSLERDKEILEVEVQLTAPPSSAIVLRLEPILMAVVFWLAGSFVLMYSQPGTLGIFFFLQYQVCSAVLATGAFSAGAPLWLSRSFFVLLWWFSSLVLHFHLLFPVSVLTRKLRWLPVLGYGVAAGGSLINILLYPD